MRRLASPPTPNPSNPPLIPPPSLLVRPLIPGRPSVPGADNANMRHDRGPRPRDVAALNLPPPYSRLHGPASSGPPITTCCRIYTATDESNVRRLILNTTPRKLKAARRVARPYRPTRDKILLIPRLEKCQCKIACANLRGANRSGWTVVRCDGEII